MNISTRTKRIASGAFATGAALYVGRARAFKTMAKPMARHGMITTLRKGGTVGKKIARMMAKRMPIGEKAAAVRSGLRRLRRSRRRSVARS